MPDQCNEATNPEVIKYDSGKSPVFRGVFKYFPKALKAVADVSAIGAKKYSAWGGWKSATFADVYRFEDALGRHLLNEHVEGWYDPESNLLHAAHAAWNALAKLELLLEEIPMESICACEGQGVGKKEDTNAKISDARGSDWSFSDSGK